jgi:hypothetical protein
LQQGISTALHETLLPSEEKKELAALRWEDSDSEENSAAADNGSTQKKAKPAAKPSAKQILLIPGAIRSGGDYIIISHWSQMISGITLFGPLNNKLGWRAG